MSKSMRLPAEWLESDAGAIRILFAEMSRWMIRFSPKSLLMVQITERRARRRSTVVKGLPDIGSFLSLIEAPQYEIRSQRCWRKACSTALLPLLGVIILVSSVEVT